MNHVKELVSFAKGGANIYQIFLRAFTPSGTLAAAEKMLPHLSDLGIDIVYLCPVVEHDDDTDPAHWSDRQNATKLGNPKNPYRLKDYFRIEPEYGTDADLKSFIASAHALGMHVILDLVYYHCGPKARFLEEHPEFVNRNEDGSIAFGPWHFPILNFESKELREHLWDNMVYFVKEFDADGYRCDVGSWVPLDFWEEGRRRMEQIKPDVFMLNEANGNQNDQNSAFDCNYSFSVSSALMSLLIEKASLADLRKALDEESKTLPEGGRHLRNFDSHDLASDLGSARAERPENHLPLAVTNAALVFCFTMDGIPFLYNGQEIADESAHTLWGSRDFGHNQCIDWSKAVTPDGQSRQEFLRELIQLRHTYEILSEGKVEWVKNDTPDSVMSYLRVSDSEKALCIVNLTKEPVKVTLDTDFDVKHAEILMDYGFSMNDKTAALLPGGFIVMRIE